MDVYPKNKFENILLKYLFFCKKIIMYPIRMTYKYMPIKDEQSGWQSLRSSECLIEILVQSAL